MFRLDLTYSYSSQIEWNLQFEFLGYLYPEIVIILIVNILFGFRSEFQTVVK